MKVSLSQPELVAESGPDVTVVILNWNRTANLNLKILPSLAINEQVKEVFVVNNNPSKSGQINPSEKIRIFDPGRDLGLDARFSVALLATTAFVVIQDDDLCLSEQMIRTLTNNSETNLRIHGVFGRRPTMDNCYAVNISKCEEQVEVVLTRALVCRRSSIHSFFELREADRIKAARKRHVEFGTNSENGEDIIFSYALRLANGGELHSIHAVPQRGIIELPEFGSAQRWSPGFRLHRTRLLRACQDVTGLL